MSKETASVTFQILIGRLAPHIEPVIDWAAIVGASQNIAGLHSVKRVNPHYERIPIFSRFRRSGRVLRFSPKIRHGRSNDPPERRKVKLDFRLLSYNQTAQAQQVAATNLGRLYTTSRRDVKGNGLSKMALHPGRHARIAPATGSIRQPSQSPNQSPSSCPR